MAASRVTLQNIQRSSISFNSRQIVASYLVEGVENADEAEVADDGTTAIPTLGTAWGATAATVTNIAADQVENAADTFEVKVTYAYNASNGGKPTNPSDGDEWWTIRTTGATVNVKTSLIAAAKYGASAPDVGFNVGQDDAGNVAGVDVLDFAAELQVHQWKAHSTVIGAGYLQGIIAAYRKTNIAAFYGFDIAQLLFSNFEIVAQGEILDELQFTFRIGTNLAVADLPTYTDINGAAFTITGGKDAHEYLWGIFAQGKDGNKKKFAPKGIYVSLMYEADDYAALHLSGTLT